MSNFTDPKPANLVAAIAALEELRALKVDDSLLQRLLGAGAGSRHYEGQLRKLAKGEEPGSESTLNTITASAELTRYVEQVIKDREANNGPRLERRSGQLYATDAIARNREMVARADKATRLHFALITGGVALLEQDAQHGPEFCRTLLEGIRATDATFELVFLDRDEPLKMIAERGVPGDHTWLRPLTSEVPVVIERLRAAAGALGDNRVLRRVYMRKVQYAPLAVNGKLLLVFVVNAAADATSLREIHENLTGLEKSQMDLLEFSHNLAVDAIYSDKANWLRMLRYPIGLDEAHAIVRQRGTRYELD